MLIVDVWLGVVVGCVFLACCSVLLIVGCWLVVVGWLLLVVGCFRFRLVVVVFVVGCSLLFFCFIGVGCSWV